MNILKEIIYRIRGDYTTEKLISMGMKVGKNFCRMNGVILDPSHCWLIEIGDDVTIAPRTHVLCHDASTKIFMDYTKVGKVKIGNRVFIGAESVILPGVTIGDDVIVGANSTVTRDIPANSVVVGSPAKVLCSLSEYIKKETVRMNNSNIYDESFTLGNGIPMEKRDQQSKELEGKIGYIL